MVQLHAGPSNDLGKHDEGKDHVRQHAAAKLGSNSSSCFIDFSTKTSTSADALPVSFFHSHLESFMDAG